MATLDDVAVGRKGRRKLTGYWLILPGAIWLALFSRAASRVRPPAAPRGGSRLGGVVLCGVRFRSVRFRGIRFRGEDITGLKPHHIVKRGLVRTFQLTTLFQEMTVLENVLVGRHTRTRSGVFTAGKSSVSLT